MSRKTAKHRAACIKQAIRDGATNKADGKLVGGKTGKAR